MNTIKLLKRALRKFQNQVAPPPENEQLLNDMEQVKQSGLFDIEFYRRSYPDVVAKRIDPLKHFLMNGWTEMRNPSEYFDTAYYLERNLDVKRTGMNPLLHYLQYGSSEGRYPTLYDENRAFGKAIELVDSENRDSEGRFILDKIQLDVVYQIHKLVEHDIHVSIINGELCFPKIGKPLITIVIPVFNNIDFTLRCIASLKRNISDSLGYEVIVVDDNSTDATLDILPKIEGLRILQNEVNVGFVGSCNRGAKAAHGEYIVFLNNDTIVMPNWLEELYASFQTISDAGLVGSMLLYPDGKLQEAGGIIWRDGSGWNYGNRKKPYDGKYLFARDVDYCSGASIMVRSDLLKRVGFFSEEFAPGYYEDTDLAFTIREAGFRTIYQPFSRVIHFEGITSGTDITSGMKRYQVVNKIKFLEKWQKTIAEHYLPEEKQYYYQDRRNMRHVLVIDACTPTPDQDSGSNDTIIHIRFLQQSGFRVTFVAGANLLRYGKYTESLQAMGVECLFTPEIFNLRDYLEDEGWRFNLVWVYRWTMLDHFLDEINTFVPQAKVVFDTVDLHFLRLQREAELLGDKEKVANAERVKDRELSLMREVDRTIVISEFEKIMLDDEKGVNGASVSVLPMCREIPGRGRGFDERKYTMVFIGSFQHPPNIDAVKGFLTDIWPNVSKKYPRLKFQIVGNKASEHLSDIVGKNVEVLGFVEDLSSLLDTCLLTIAPLRYGAGVKGKTLSSMSHGVPCIMSSIACEGTSFENGKHCIVADSEEQYIKALGMLTSDPAFWEKISNGGLELMKENYSLQGVQMIFNQILDELDLG